MASGASPSTQQPQRQPPVAFVNGLSDNVASESLRGDKLSIGGVLLLRDLGGRQTMNLTTSQGIQRPAIVQTNGN